MTSTRPSGSRSTGETKKYEGTNFRLIVHVLHLHLISLLRRNQLTSNSITTQPSSVKSK